jgi:hypothetical protein
MIPVLLVSLVMVSWAYSPQVQSAPANRAQASAPQQRGTDSLPISVKLINPGQTQAQAAQDAERIKQDRRLATQTFYTNVALVTATILTLLVLCFQSYWLRRQVTLAEQAAAQQAKDMNASIRAAQKSIFVSRDTAKRELRAYIGRDGLTLASYEGKPTGTTHLQFRVGIENNGRTPAFGVNGAVRLALYPAPLPTDADATPPDPSRPLGYLSPGKEVSLVTNTVVLTNDELTDVVNVSGPRRLYLFGHVAYTDAFQRAQSFQFIEGIVWDAVRGTPTPRGAPLRHEAT